MYKITFCLLGALYLAFEVTFNAIFEKESWKEKIRLQGQSSVYMFPVGGFIGILFLWLYSIPVIHGMSMLGLAMFFGGVITIVEAIAGYMLNIKLKLNLWDYSKAPLNWKGQTDIIHFVGWTALSPFIIWIIDRIQGIDYGVLENYKRIITDITRNL